MFNKQLSWSPQKPMFNKQLSWSPQKPAHNYFNISCTIVLMPLQTIQDNLQKLAIFIVRQKSNVHNINLLPVYFLGHTNSSHK